MIDKRQSLERFLEVACSSTDLEHATGMEFIYKSEGKSFKISAPIEVKPPIMVTKAHVEKAIIAADAGRISMEDLIIWANVLILCDSYEVASPYEEAVLAALHYLASPSIYGSLTAQRLADIRSGLERSGVK